MVSEREVFVVVIIALVAGMIVGAFAALDYASQPDNTPVPCHCQKCEAKCCEVGK